VDILGLGSDIASISSGDRHTCAVTTAGGATCWGSNSNGRLGVGLLGGEYLSPIDVAE